MVTYQYGNNMTESADPNKKKFVTDFILLVGEQFKVNTENFEIESKLSPHETRVLRILHQNGPLIVKKIAYHLDNIPLSSLTRVLDRLEKNRFIQRDVNQRDRRSFMVLLTENGKKVVINYHHQMEKMADLMLEALTPAEQLIMIELLHKIQNSLNPTKNS